MGCKTQVGSTLKNPKRSLDGFVWKKPDLIPQEWCQQEQVAQVFPNAIWRAVPNDSIDNQIAP